MTPQIKSALAGMKFNKDTYQTIFKLADGVWLANGGAATTPAVVAATQQPAAAAAAPQGEASQVAATSFRGRGGRGRGGSQARGRGRGGRYNNSNQNNNTRQNSNATNNSNSNSSNPKPHQRGPRHSDGPQTQPVLVTGLRVVRRPTALTPWCVDGSGSLHPVQPSLKIKIEKLARLEIPKI